MRSRKLLIFILTETFIAAGIQAQIFAPAADDSLIASYGTDEIFIFNRPEYKAEINASVIAISVDSMADWTFQWSVYEPLDSAYITLPGTSIGRISELDTVTVSSGYLVQITRGPEVDTFRVWIIINDLDVKITNKDEADTLLYGYYDCTSLDLHSDTIRPALFYYNPFNHNRLDPGDLYTIRWTTDNPEATTPGSRLLTRVNNPPWKDTWYKITVSDRFGITRSDSVIYNSINPKANIIKPAEYIKPSDPLLNSPPKAYIEHFYDYPDDVVSAPALFKFDISESRNMVNYELNYGDGDSILMGNDSLVLFHEFRKPGTYKVVLTARSNKPFECLDVDSTDVEISFAKEDNFIMPNVFTPGDGDVIEFNESTINNIFRTQTDVSVIYIDIAIFTRTGKKVHEFEGNIRDWEGWNGRIKDTGQKAPTGVYFYVITRLDAFQDPNDPTSAIKRKVLKGFFHLYRD